MAVDINNKLKLKSKQIDIADLFIAGIAMSNNMYFATLNKKHFERIDGLELIK
jgi:tRNA(fMet)-specific endonuclease VapC